MLQFVEKSDVNLDDTIGTFVRRDITVRVQHGVDLRVVTLGFLEVRDKILECPTRVPKCRYSIIFGFWGLL